MPAALAVSLLVIAVLDYREARPYRAARAAEEFRPRYGSLVGFDQVGQRLRAPPHGWVALGVLGPPGEGRSLRYWSRAAGALAAGGAAAAQLWAVCASRGSCSGAVPVPGLRLAEFLDPYEMSVAARAGRRGEMLIYHGAALAGRIKLPAEPALVAGRLSGLMKGVGHERRP